MKLITAFLFLLALSSLSTCLSFTFGPLSSLFGTRTIATSTTTRRQAQENPDFSLDDLGPDFEECEILSFSLKRHKPLGCTVEESLVASSFSKDVHPPVFVVKVTEGGFAQEIGLEVGDVVVGVTGIFEQVTNVVGMGIDHVKSLVAGRSKEKVLELVIARGTSVMSDHETALVDLCTNPTSFDKEVDECVALINGMAYNDLDNVITQQQNDDETTIVNGNNNVNGDQKEDAKEEVLLDNMFSMWAEDMPQPTSKPETKPKPQASKKPAPWSSRSSPSGTYVRDPATGELRNIDA